MDDQRILVFDLECSCWLGHPPKGMRQEVIEIGVCILDMTTTAITGTRSLIVKPKTSEISRFCSGFTGISQEMVDTDGMSLEEACEVLVNEYSSRTIPSSSWGKFDAKFLKKDCAQNGIQYPLSSMHSNAQKTFKTKMGHKQETSVSNALKQLDKQFIGKKHRAINDAYNTAVILSDILCGVLDHGSK